MLRRRGWVAGWVSVTRRYCIKTAKPILKLFRPSGSPIILVTSDPCADTQFQGEPLQRGMVWYGILGFNVPLDTVKVISETGALEQ